MKPNTEQVIKRSCTPCYRSKSNKISFWLGTADEIAATCCMWRKSILFNKFGQYNNLDFSVIN